MQMLAKYQCFLQRPNSEWCLMQITWPMAEEPELWSQISLWNCDTVIVCGVVHNRLSAVFYGISTSISSNKDLQVCSNTSSFPPNQWCIFHTTLESAEVGGQVVNQHTSSRWAVQVNAAYTHKCLTASLWIALTLD